MDLDDIKFTEWQIDKIRVALGKYRIANASNGQRISWRRIRDDVIFSDVNIDHYFEDDAELVFKHEALRRFAAYESVLELDKLKDVTRFLLHEGMLEVEGLDENDVGLKKMLAAHEYLANTSESAKQFLTDIAGTYICRKKNPLIEHWQIFTLRIIPDPSKEFVRVEEIFETGSEDLFNYKTIREQNPFTNIRTAQVGYGFSVTKDNFLHLFLTGQEPGVRSAYVQADEVSFAGPDCKTIAYMHLYRHGYRNSIDLYGEPLPDGPDSLYFIDASNTKYADAFI